MKTIVIYQSKTGFAKKYAQWISEVLSAECVDACQVKPATLDEYDLIIFGGGVYATGINGVKLITNNFEKLKSKKLIVFATGLSPSSDAVINDLTDRNFTSQQQENIKFFYVRGGFDYPALSAMDKALMNIMKWIIKRKQSKGKQLTEDEIGMINAFDMPVDFTKKENADELISYARTIIQ